VSTNANGDQPKPSGVKAVGKHVERGQSWINDFQARHWIIAFPFAVFRKYSDDKASRLSALLTYYGFISIFPILLLFVVILQIVLQGHATLRQNIINAVVPEQFRATVEQAVTSLPSAGLPLAIGIVSLLLAGLGGAYAAYATVTQIGQVPYRKWYGFGPRYLRVLTVLIMVIGGAIALGALIAVSGRVHVFLIGSPFWNFVLSVVVVWLLLHTGVVLLSPRRTSLRETWIGCTLGSVSVMTIMYLGGRLLTYIVGSKSAVYGVFASFIGLLALTFILAQAVVISAEISTVWVWRLWPRSIDIFVYFDADVRAMELLANMEARMPRERVTVSFVDDPKDDPDPYREDVRVRGGGRYGRDPWDAGDATAVLDSESPTSGSASRNIGETPTD